MKLSKLLHDAGIKGEGTTENNREDPEILGISCDSRQVHPGDLFLCLRGMKDSGEHHIQEAIGRGAAAVLRRLEDGSYPTGNTAAELSDVLYGHPQKKLILIGVTGTNGKTTTTWLIRQCLNRLGVGCGLIGTVAYDTGGKHEDERTTPQADCLYRLMRDMVDHGLEACAMEVSSHGLALGRTASLRFSYGVFTNLTEDHLDFHETMESYYQAKKLLFRQVEHRSFINVEDPWGARLYEELKQEGHPVTPVSLQRDGGDVVMELPGRYNRENGLMALSVCEAVIESQKRQETRGELLNALKTVQSVPGRFEPVVHPSGRRVYVDYAHTPDALERVLNTAREMVSHRGKLICVFGCGGDRDRGKRPLMGEISGRLADYTIITSDNPRSEKMEEIAEQIETGLRPTKGSYEILTDRKKAIEKALTMGGDEDIVIIAGKGHETRQIIENTSYPFDDRQVVRACLDQICGNDSTK